MHNMANGNLAEKKLRMIQELAFLQGLEWTEEYIEYEFYALIDAEAIPLKDVPMAIQTRAQLMLGTTLSAFENLEMLLNERFGDNADLPYLNAARKTAIGWLRFLANGKSFAELTSIDAYLNLTRNSLNTEDLDRTIRVAPEALNALIVDIDHQIELTEEQIRFRANRENIRSYSGAQDSDVPIQIDDNDKIFVAELVDQSFKYLKGSFSDGSSLLRDSNDFDYIHDLIVDLVLSGSIPENDDIREIKLNASHLNSGLLIIGFAHLRKLLKLYPDSDAKAKTFIKNVNADKVNKITSKLYPGQLNKDTIAVRLNYSFTEPIIKTFNKLRESI